LIVVRALLFPLSVVTLLACLVFGGGAARGLSSDYAPQFLAIPLLYFALSCADRSLLHSRGLLLLAGAVCALPLLHLIPLPPSLWTALPGRDLMSASFEAAGLPLPFLPLSMRPDETWRALLFLVPPIALLLAVLQMTSVERVWLVAALISFACLNVLVGMVQVISGGNASYYPYAFTNLGRSVGLFANANHTIACFYAIIPIAAALLGDGKLKTPVPTWAILGALGFVFVLGLSLSGSRTALILGGLSLALTCMFILHAYLHDFVSRTRILLYGALAGLIILPVALGVGLSTILARFETQDVLEDARWSILPGALRALNAVFPAGSGMGSFETVYQIHETYLDVSYPFVNHAHNDWLEIVFEGGLPGLAILACALGWLTHATICAFRAPDDGALSDRLAKAAALALWFLALHSLWDYPLRTIALASLVAICFATLRPPAPDHLRSFASVPGFLEPKAKHRRRKRSTSVVGA
jgi:O-antigen ligase